jgi:DNA-binding winged helix-turn-helix (wHTH) protein
VKLRSLLFWLHLICGVVAGVVILIMSVTGVLLAYQRQITAWADTRGYHITPGPERLSADAINVQYIDPNAVTVTLINKEQITLEADTQSTVFIVGTLGDRHTKTVVNPLPAITAGNAEVQVMQTVASQPSLDVYLTDAAADIAQATKTRIEFAPLSSNQPALATPAVAMTQKALATHLVIDIGGSLSRAAWPGARPLLHERSVPNIGKSLGPSKDSVALGRGPMSLSFGDFKLDQERRQLLRSGRPVPLEPKAYELLSLLVERRPRALSRAQIRDVVWPGVFISESTLNQAVNSIRRALDDDARQPRFLRTARGFGYAFCDEARDSTDGQLGTGPTARELESSPPTRVFARSPKPTRTSSSVARPRPPHCGRRSGVRGSSP